MVRRVVTGEDGDGSTRVVSDSQIELSMLGGGFKFAQLWGSDAIPSFPNDGAAPGYDALFPASCGYRFTQMTIEPQQQVQNLEEKALDPEIWKLYADAGIDDAAVGEAPGMHRTDTIDLGVVISGMVTMELDGGERVDLKAGDVFVQNGTNHKWSNPGDVPVHVLVAMIGGARRA